jgi:N-formylmaleamate deformylase
MASSPNKPARASTFLYGAHVRANGIRQHYLRYGGRGQPLVLVPGITSPAITWGFVGERLGESFDTYVLDVRGRGLSEGGAHLKYTLEDYAADVAQLAQALGLERYLALGHSMGARIVARLAHRFPAPIARVVLVDPPVSGPGRRPYVRPLEYYMEAIRQARQGTFDVAAVRKTYPSWSEESIRLRAEWLHTCDDTAIAETVRGFQEEEIHSDMAALRMPALLVVAGKGGVISDADIAEIRALAPGMAVKKVEHTGHMIPFDDLGAFLGALQGFLAGG